MKFEWKNRTDNDELVLQLMSDLICSRVVHANHMILTHDGADDGDRLCFDFDESGIVAAMELLDIDAEWILGFMQRRSSGNVPYVGNVPVTVLAKGYSFELRHVSSCDDATDLRPCCVRPYIYVVKDA